jgi:hypothetical protein
MTFLRYRNEWTYQFVYVISANNCRSLHWPWKCRRKLFCALGIYQTIGKSR